MFLYKSNFILSLILVNVSLSLLILSSIYFNLFNFLILVFKPCLFLSSNITSFSQTENVGINVTPDNSAVLDAQPLNPATNPKGLRIPTLTTTREEKRILEQKHKVVPSFH
jgi:hypothetical protein